MQESGTFVTIASVRIIFFARDSHVAVSHERTDGSCQAFVPIAGVKICSLARHAHAAVSLERTDDACQPLLSREKECLFL